MQRYQKPIVVLILILIFSAWFIRNTKQDLHLIFQKDLLAHDESSNSVVAANITRKFFPPMVRVNPLDDKQGNWMEGPVWDHIPPLFTYVPYLFFKLDGQVTIEVKRLSYALITWLTGLLFILSVYNYKKSFLAGLAGTIAGIFWINTPFTRELITGYAFGASDIVLAFTVVGTFVGLIWYLREDREQRLNYGNCQLALLGILVALPIMAKSLLGAIPAATLFGLLLWDHKKISKQFWQSFLPFAVALGAYFTIFPIDFGVSFLHLKNLEGWGRPWYFYLTNYLPQRYLGHWTWPFYIGLVFVAIANYGFRIKRKTANLALGWFIWNLIVISIVKSKIPNFIYQNYLLSLYAIIYGIFVMISNVVKDRYLNFWKGLLANYSKWLLFSMLCFSVVATGYELVTFSQQFKAHKAQAYSYQSEHEKFYQTAENLRGMGVGTKDLTVVFLSDNDCWLRYYILFLTGAESKTLLELSFNLPSEEIVKQKYNRIFFVWKGGIKQIKYSDVKMLISDHQQEISDNVLRIKKDKTSCQWLVPDPILNAP